MKTLRELVIKQKLPIQLGEKAYLQAQYEPANLQQGGRVIKPPRYRWFLYEGICDLPYVMRHDIQDEAFMEALLAGVRSGESFEYASFGMFYKREEGFELLLSAGNANKTGPNYGLPSLNLQPVKVAGTALLQPGQEKKRSGNLWWMQVAATVLFIVLLNVLALTYLSENGGLSFKQPNKASLFDSLKEPDPFSYEEDTLEELSNVPDLSTAQKPWQTYDSLQEATSGVVTEAATAPEIKVQVVSAKEVPVKLAQKAPEPNMESKASQKVVREEANQASVKVVVGAFGQKDNADKWVVTLRKRGFEAQVLLPKAGTLYRVIVVNAESSSTESDFLKQVQENIHPQAWVLAE